MMTYDINAKVIVKRVPQERVEGGYTLIKYGKLIKVGDTGYIASNIQDNYISIGFEHKGIFIFFLDDIELYSEAKHGFTALIRAEKVIEAVRKLIENNKLDCELIDGYNIKQEVENLTNALQEYDLGR